MNSVCKTLMAAVLLTAAIALAQEEVTGNPEKGEQVYLDHACFACHAYDGSGRRKIIGTPKGLGPEPRSLTYLANRARGVLVNEAVFITYLRARSNSNPEFPNQSMPNYPASSLSDAEARDLYAYILTFVDDTPEVEEIPLMQEILEAAAQ